MADLSTTYMGLKLANPLIVSSCTHTFTADGVARLADAGAAAVVMKSIFEEEIRAQVSEMYNALQGDMHPEALEYLRADLPMQVGPEKYLARLSEIKAAVDIPVIASINCVSSDQWIAFARQLEAAGADALELNVYDVASDPACRGDAVEQRHAALVRDICSQARIPVAVKLGPYYSSLAEFAVRLDGLGASALVLFNRFFQPDIDTEQLGMGSSINYSRPADQRVPLRWIAIVRDLVRCDLSLTTGVHDAEGAIKAILAGANTVQVCSVLYQKGFEQIGVILDGLRAWMDRKSFADVAAFRGRMRAGTGIGQRGFERAQYMKTFVGLE